MYVIGTAGHVDHGKSTLVQALTGIDPDRWEEEKARQMTIDLGFAWLRLDGLDEEVGIIDVPGHRDFIDNMLAGVGGIDLALFVVAADEGVMPQTREHLAILNLLEIGGGVIALTKSDLVADPDWLELVMLEVSEVVAGTVLAEAPLVPVSAVSGQGLPRLESELAARLSSTEPRTNVGQLRLPVDRAFSLPGFGTIVTGTLLGGQLKVGDDVEIQPGGRSGRVRGLQMHKAPVETAYPGSRIAVNLTGISKESITRGDVLTAPGSVRATNLIDVTYRHLPEAQLPLKHNTEVKLHAGAAETMARCRVIGARQIEPGQEGSLQLALSRALAASRGDRFILRQPSPPATLGGGRVLDAHPGRRHRRFKPEVTRRFRTLSQGSPADRLFHALERGKPVRRADLEQRSSLSPLEVSSALAQLVAEAEVRQVDEWILLERRWREALEGAITAVSDYHMTYPLRPGIPREELRSRLRLPGTLFSSLLAEADAQERLVADGSVVRRPEHEITFSTEQRQLVDRLLAQFALAEATPPSVSESKAAVGDEVYSAMVTLGQLKQISHEVVYRHGDYEETVNEILDYLDEHGRVSAAEVRDLLQTSRKYAIALLEHLDQMKVTRRVGDYRERR